jgi:hypothetical protein
VAAFTQFVLGGGYARGLFLAVGDVNDDDHADLILGSAAGASNVTAFSGEALADGNTRTAVANFVPAGANGVVRVGVRDVDGDGVSDVLTSSGEQVSAFEGSATLPPSGPPPVYN